MYIVLKYALRYIEMVTKLWLALAVGFSWFLSLFCTLLGYWLLAIGYSQAIGVLLLILVFPCLLVIAFCHHSHCLFNHSTTRKANFNRTDFRRSHCKVPRGKKSLENDRYYYRFCVFVVFGRSGTHFSGSIWFHQSRIAQCLFLVQHYLFISLAKFTL